MVYLLAVILVIAAILLFRQAGRQQRETGLPAGRVTYSDTGLWKRVETPLYDNILHLTGRPDYLVQEGGELIPVEVKSSWAPPTPYEGHLYQLAAYCRLVEQTYHRRPSHGILQYRNRTFAIDYTPELEDRLLDILGEMRQAERQGEVDRSHDEPARCARCGYRSSCDQRM
jgi:CRISPR-associated exonuclease Cas4